MDDEIARLDTEYRALVSGNQVPSQQVEPYRSAPGVGLLTAGAHVAGLPGLGGGDGKALSGLAPWTRDGGR